MNTKEFMAMSDAPERIWLSYAATAREFDIPIARPEKGHDYPGIITEYRRVDLPPTLAQALAVPEVKALVSALDAMIGAVCGDTGFAACVRADTGLAYPWPVLDAAEERARSALRAVESE